MRYHLSAVGAGFAAALVVLFHSPSHAAQGRNAAAAAGLAVGAAGLYMLMQGRSQAEPIVEEEVIVERRRPRYVPTCHLERRKVWLDDETYTYRRVEVCE
ncbi:MAG: hypothetical protein IOC54_08955 [Methylobacterium sp.]|nr:hypothetical protein [Methylobacterium sp.]MCA3651951.1 hypothetical protein [Methylobacterium sp.]MCA4922812.1 hypothetical protein [Methylobacterium sp.]